MRGSPPNSKGTGSEQGSIPAGAGEPLHAESLTIKIWVYPRGCGGAELPDVLHGLARGLSPRVRGSQSSTLRLFSSLGSIPAGAGEPHGETVGVIKNRVYPRGCGGADSNAKDHFQTNGLSPRVRGSRAPHKRERVCVGSIPAGAGEPPRHAQPGYRMGVYPRGCGGAHIAKISGTIGEGLSPRVRGSRVDITLTILCKGSIPAGAGEPNQ